jgi:hypothetical protein
MAAMVKGRRVSRFVGALAVIGFLAAGCGGGKGSTSATGGAGGPSGGGGSTGSGGATGGGGALGGATGKGGGGALGGATGKGGGGALGGATGTGGGGSAGSGAGGQLRDGGSDAAEDPALLSFCQSVHAAMVSRLGSCDGIAPAIAEQLLNIDPCAAWEGAIAAGTLLFDATNASACLTAMQSWACDADAVPNGCNGVLQGLVPTGGACNVARQRTFFSECQAGAICLPGGGSSACQGTCANLALLGQSCASVPCTSGETCDLSTYTCATKGSNGDACGGAAYRLCGEGLYCNDLVNGGTCQPQHATGTCTTQTVQTECAPPAQCVYGFDITGTCQPLLQPGDACTNGDFDCPNTMHCDANNTCQPGAAIGQPCEVTGDGEQILCVVGACNTNAGTIANPVCTTTAPGATCVQDAECGPNALCAVGNTDSYTRCTSACF